MLNLVFHNVLLKLCIVAIFEGQKKKEKNYYIKILGLLSHLLA